MLTVPFSPVRVLRRSLLTIAFIGLAFTTNPVTAHANMDGKNRISVEDYVSRYKFVAVEEMNVTGIPASITLAQAILESRYGNSELAQTANNHFGIKCHDWTGEKVFYDDNRPNECFRKYRSSYESFSDHSLFLQRNRYAELFTFATTDYRAWAQGLQDAGYATNQEYAERLVDLIERYELYKFDSEISAGMVANTTTNTAPRVDTPTEQQKMGRNRISISGTPDYAPNEATAMAQPSKTRKQQQQNIAAQRTTDNTRRGTGRLKRSEPFYYNRIKTIVLKGDATPKQIAGMYGVSATKVARYNDLKINGAFPAQTKIFLQPKRRRGPQNLMMHTVKAGETMASISQEYGIRLNRLLKRNLLANGMEPAVGQVVYLRDKAHSAPMTTIGVEYMSPQPQQEQNDKRNRIVINGDGARTTAPKAETASTYNNNSYNEAKKAVQTRPNTVSTAPKTSTPSNNYGNYSSVKTQPTTTTGTRTYGNTNAPTNNDVQTTYSNNNKVETVYVNKPVTTTAPTKTYPTTSTTTTRRTTTSSTNYASANDNSPTIFDAPAYNGEASGLDNGFESAYNTTNSYTNTTAATTTTPMKSTWTVVKGDTLYNISKRNECTVSEIKDWNNLSGNTIKLGQKLIIFK